MVLIYATSNKGKVASLQRRLSREEIIQIDFDFPEPRTFNVESIAKAKASFAYEHIKETDMYPREQIEDEEYHDMFGLVANDAGFSISALNDWPESFVNFELEKFGIEGFLKLMEGVEDRRAEFRHSLAYICPVLDRGSGEPLVYSDSIKGTVAYEPRGTRREFHWSDLSRIFIPQNLDCTLAEMTEEEYKNARVLSGSEPSCSEVFADGYYVLKMLENAKPGMPLSKSDYRFTPKKHPYRKDNGFVHPWKKD
ncbi:hypothetical protein GOV10_00490 [Candidatus Woesearchaeota archaeon]|nr:hypothetical protein [Candidatus Woesearchaeota archaeon]